MSSSSVPDLAAQPAGRRRILVVDDEHATRDLLRRHLSLAGFAIEEAAAGSGALERAQLDRFDLIVLDLQVADLDGITLCRAIRLRGANTATPILMLMARATESDKVLGLESGADDYLAKPLDVRELRARVSAVLRREGRFGPPDEEAPPRLIESHELTLDVARRRAAVHGEPVVLTRREFDLLHVLVARPGIVFSRAALLSRVWNDHGCATERTVDTVLSRLRRKIERTPHDPKLILTAWGVGYKFADVE